MNKPLLWIMVFIVLSGSSVAVLGQFITDVSNTGESINSLPLPPKDGSGDGSGTLTDRIPPTVYSSHFPSNSVLKSGTFVTIRANAFDSSGVSAVWIFVDNTVVKGCKSSICSYTAAFTEGRHTYYAEAIDRYGNEGVSQSQSFTIVRVGNTTNGSIIPPPPPPPPGSTDTTPPSVKISHSPNTLLLPYTTVTITSLASDSSGIRNLDIFVNGVRTRACLSTNSCQYSSSFPAGTYSYYATAVDSEGNAAQSLSGIFTVDRCAPIACAAPPPNCWYERTYECSCGRLVCEPEPGEAFVDLKINSQDGPVSVSSGATLTLTWTSFGVDNCFASGNWFGTRPLSGKEAMTAPKVSAPTELTYTLECTSSTGIKTRDYVKVTVAPSVASIKVVSPNGGETWHLGTKQTVKWISSAAFNAVDILLVDSQGTRIALALNTANDGSETVTPQVLPGEYKIEVSASADRVSDTSDAPFSIVAAITTNTTTRNTEITFVFDDCEGANSSNCVPWNSSEKKIITDFIYGPGKTTSDNSLTGAYQIIRGVIGPPYASRTLKIRHDPTSPYNAFYSADAIVIKGFDISGITVGDTQKNILRELGHEIVHAFQDPSYYSTSYTEGVARMLEIMIGIKLNLIDYKLENDHFFTNPDQNNDPSMAFKDGELFSGILALSGNGYSLNGATFYKLYLEDKDFWKRFYNVLHSNSRLNKQMSAKDLLDLVKTEGPSKVEGLSLNDWLASRTAFNYNPIPGTDIILEVSSNAFLNIFYIYRDALGMVSQDIPDSNGQLKPLACTEGNCSDINVTVRYYDYQGNLIPDDEPIIDSSWGGFFVSERYWISHVPLNRNEKIKAEVVFKVKSTGLILKDEMWMYSPLTFGGVAGIISKSYSKQDEVGSVQVYALSNPQKVYNMNVSKGAFYFDPSQFDELNDLEGPILIKYKDSNSQIIGQRQVNKVPGPLTIIGLVDSSTSTKQIIVKASTDLNGNVGQQYFASFFARGGTPSYSWKMTSGNLPPGLELVHPDIAAASISACPEEGPCLPPANPVWLRGVPTKAGEYKFELTAVDAAGKSGKEVFVVSIRAGQITIKTESRLVARVGESFSASFIAGNGVAPYAWNAEGLPPGLSLKQPPQSLTATAPCYLDISGEAICPPQPAQILLAGVPTQAGEYKFTLVAKDSAGNAGRNTFILVVSNTGAASVVISTDKPKYALSEKVRINAVVRGTLLREPKLTVLVTRPDGTTERVELTRRIWPIVRPLPLASDIEAEKVEESRIRGVRGTQFVREVPPAPARLLNFVYTGVYENANAVGDYRVWMERRPNIEYRPASFTVFDSRPLEKYLILHDIGEYKFARADVQKHDIEGIRPNVYTAEYASQAGNAAVYVLEFSSREEAVKVFEDMITAARDNNYSVKSDKISGNDVLVITNPKNTFENSVFWMHKNFIIFGGNPAKSAPSETSPQPPPVPPPIAISPTGQVLGDSSDTPPAPPPPSPPPGSGQICPAVCTPLWKLKEVQCVTAPCLPVCEFNECGSGCGADNVRTFTTESECRARIPDYCGTGSTDGRCYCKVNEVKQSVEDCIAPAGGDACLATTIYYCAPANVYCGSGSTIPSCYCKGDEVKQSATPECAADTGCPAGIYYCAPKQTELPMPVIRAYLEKYPSDLGRTLEKKGVTSDELLDIVFRLENLRTKFDSMEKNALRLADYYRSTGDAERAERFDNIASLFNEGKTRIDSIIEKIRNNIDNPSLIIDEVRQDVKDLKDLLRRILLRMIGAPERAQPVQQAQARLPFIE